MRTPEDGMKILARMIAEAYMEELYQKTSQEYLPEKKESKDADKGNIRNCEMFHLPNCQ
jgi:hypothetical protein